MDGINLTYNGTQAGSVSPPPLNADLTDYQQCLTPTLTVQWDYKGEYWVEMDSGRGGGYVTSAPPNGKSCNAGSPGTAWSEPAPTIMAV